jgi:23S rRNA (uracil1939-C5)-methyltransferase
MANLEGMIEVEIERILPGGVGLAHAEEMTVFVYLAAPGDLVRVEVERTRGKVAFASITEIIKPSPLRVEPPCPYFGRCGGCDFQQLGYETQLQTKVEIIRDCLHRLGGFDPVPDFEIQPSPNEWHYRARANWQVDRTTNALGYFERGSNRVCDVEFCAVLVPELQAELERVRAQLPRIDPGRNIEAVAGDEGVSVASDSGKLEAKVVCRRIAGETYHFSAAGFFQINHDLLEPIIKEAIGDATGELALDLYCGVGLFTLPLARRFKKVVGIETNRTATAFARQNLKAADLSNALVETARVGDWMQANSSSLGPVNFLLLDPPRTGAENKDIYGILELRPSQISYVSCDPATLARDLKKLIAAGYKLQSIKAFDMFPQTHHVETVVRLVQS